MLEQYNDSSILKINSNNSIQSNVNIVKELIDNSLDSGADSIILDLINYGTKKITIIDNGKGIEKNIFNSLGTRGATTKVSKIAMINTIKTHGFRGQALSAIAHLCDLQIITKTKYEDSPYLLRFSNNGNVQNIRKIPDSDFKEERNFWKNSDSGTITIVDNVFKNNEIRRDSICNKKDLYYNEILNLVQAYVIINFNVSFDVFIKDDNSRKKVLHFENDKEKSNNLILIVYIYTK